jgi:hypothetical protein
MSHAIIRRKNQQWGEKVKNLYVIPNGNPQALGHLDSLFSTDSK